MLGSDLAMRRAGDGDQNALSVVGAATFLESFIEQIPGHDLVRHCQTQHAADIYIGYLTRQDPRYACWLVEYTPTGAPIGYAVTCPPELPVETGAQDIELKRIYVFSKFHGSGAGKHLQQAADNHGRDLGCSRILLGTYEGNARAIAFYRREGYSKIGRRKFQVGNIQFDDIVMAKPL